LRKLRRQLRLSWTSRYVDPREDARPEAIRSRGTDVQQDDLGAQVARHVAEDVHVLVAPAGGVRGAGMRRTPAQRGWASSPPAGDVLATVPPALQRPWRSVVARHART
jgi:hypothetical protein